MDWRVKPEELLIEVGKLFGSKTGLQKLNYEVSMGNSISFRTLKPSLFTPKIEFLSNTIRREFRTWINYQRESVAISNYDNCRSL